MTHPIPKAGIVAALLMVFHVNVYVQPVHENRPRLPYQKGVRLLTEQRYAEAIQAFRTTIEEDVNFVPAYRKLVQAHYLSNDLHGVLEFFAALNVKHPEHAAVLYGLGMAHQNSEDFARAAEFFRKSLQLNPQFGDVYTRFCDVYAKRNRLKEAEQTLSELTRAHPQNAFLHYALGYVRQLREQWQESQPFLEQALQLNPHLLEAHLAKANSFTKTGQLAEAMEAFEAGLTKAKQNNDLAFQSKFLGGLGTMYYLRREPKKAMQYFEQAVDLAQKAAELADQGNWLGRIGAVHLLTGNYPKATESLQQALDIARRFKDKRQEMVQLGNLAVVQAYLGNYEQAMQSFRACAEIGRQMGDEATQMKMLANVGTAAGHLGDYAAALQSYQGAIRVARRIGDRRNEALYLQNSGAAYAWFGNYNKAIEFYQRALNLADTLQDRRIQALALMNAGYAHWQLGHHEQARQHYTQALKKFRAIEDRKNESTNLANLGMLYWDQGDYATAFDYTSQALEISKSIGYRFGIGYQLNNLGDIKLAQGEPEMAREYYAQALRVGEEIGSLEIVWRAHQGLAQSLDRIGELLTALDHYQRAVATIEDVRSKIRVEEQKTAFFQSKIGVYKRLVHLLFRLHQQQPDKEWDRKAFFFSEKARGRALLDLLAESRINVKAGVPAELLEQERAIFRNLAGLHTNLQNAQLTQEQRQAILDGIRSEEEALAAVKLELKHKSPAYLQLKYPEPIDVHRAQKELLANNEILLAYSLDEPQSYLWVISRNSFAMYPLPSQEEMAKQAKKYLSILQRPPRLGVVPKVLGRDLYEKLISPLAPMLDESAHLIVMADDILHYLPFEALVNEDSQYLIEKVEISYVHSASVLKFIREHRNLGRVASKSPQKLLAFGDPIFGKNAEMALRGTESAEDSGLYLTDIQRGLYDEQGVNFIPLPNTGAEVESIAALFPDQLARIYLRDQATEDRLKREALSDYTYLHFATHGYLDETVPGRSCVVLTLDDDPTEDGFLQVQEVFNLRLNADLVVLSACQTGLGKLLNGEGLIGLTRAFLYAGARSVVVSLWSVSDVSTARLMASFYNYMQKGDSKAAALRKAKLSLLHGQSDALKHPFHWAPFVLIGTPH